MTVTVAGDGRAARLVIAEDGPGIRPSKREDVLKRFVRLDASRHQPGNVGRCVY